MGRKTALIIAAVALALGGLLFMTGADAPPPAEGPPVVVPNG